ncbi:DUF5131 family protein [uncultured Reyranella sp.]|uniref:DUF5131 family protein n=1 Tax=uncultured Reyranella sp. TaxID=735512 RepID=UPI00259CE3A5|nr:DUF5131 family protein [uncultured Reyranella sp.]
MTEASKIEWTDHTFSPWLGCTPVSAACDNCYAAALSARYGWPVYRKAVPRRLSSPSTWKLPRRWQRKAAANGVRARVFPSLCDPYDKEVSDDWRDDFMEEIEATPDLDWLLLTKRPQVAQKYHRRQRLPPNVGLGVTAENQAMADLRIPRLLSIEGPKFRFVSVEPILGPVDLLKWFDPMGACCGLGPEMRCRDCPADADWRYSGPITAESLNEPTLDWIIAGGESGPKARPSDPDHFRALRDQCIRYGVAFFFKQWGEHAPAVLDVKDGEAEPWRIYPDGRRMWGLAEALKPRESWPREIMVRVGKKAAGAELDGQHWRQLPPQMQRAA